MTDNDPNRIRWRKSSRSGAQGGECVEVGAVWRKSSRSGPQGGQCVELADLRPAVAVRDSKHPDDPYLAFGRRAFARFAGSLKHS